MKSKGVIFSSLILLVVFTSFVLGGDSLCIDNVCDLYWEDTVTVTVNGSTYQVSLDFVGSSTVKFNVNGELTNTLSEGQTFKLSDGSYIEVISIYQAVYQGDISNAKFSINFNLKSECINNSCKLYEGGTITSNDHTYSINYIGNDGVKFKVNGELTNTLSVGGKFRLADNSYIKVTSINIQDYVGGIKTVEFLIGDFNLKSECINNSCKLYEGGTVTIIVGDSTYEVYLDFIGSSTVKFNVNGELTNTLSEGQTFKLSDGSYIEVIEINTQDYQGGIKTVKFSITLPIILPDNETGPIDLPKNETYVCQGCTLEEKCYPFNYRTNRDYCDAETNEFVKQVFEGKCNNNFECKSNLCIDSQCIEEGFFKRIINWFKRLFGL